MVGYREARALLVFLREAGGFGFVGRFVDHRAHAGEQETGGAA